MSVHRGNGFYPNTGAATDIGTDAGQGFTVNVRKLPSDWDRHAQDLRLGSICRQCSEVTQTGCTPLAVLAKPRTHRHRSVPQLRPQVPWSKGSAGDLDYLAAWELVLGPIAAAFAPQAVLVSAGFDAAEGDPLGGCRLTPHGYGKMTVRPRAAACCMSLMTSARLWRQHAGWLPSHAQRRWQACVVWPSYRDALFYSWIDSANSCFAVLVQSTCSQYLFRVLAGCIPVAATGQHHKEHCATASTTVLRSTEGMRLSVTDDPAQQEVSSTSMSQA